MQSDLPHNTGWTAFITINILNCFLVSSILGPNVFLSALYLSAVIYILFLEQEATWFYECVMDADDAPWTKIRSYVSKVIC
jgi:hypothetical protein